MSALTPTIRQVTLITFFQERRHGATLNQIAAHMAGKMEIDGQQYVVRNFQRDKSAILKNYGITIGYNKAGNVYRIVHSPADVGIQSIEAFELLSAVLREENFAGYILFDNRKALGLAHFEPLLKAIKKRLLVRFDYQKFNDQESGRRLVEPYAVKEFKGRWYLLALDMRNLEIKTFGLDRMTNVEPSKKKFDYPEAYDPQEVFKNCFGITSPDKGQHVEEVILQFTPRQYNYVKSYPLHQSQRDIEGVGPQGQRQVSLQVCLNHDLEMELLSYGDQVLVVAPAHFKKRIKERLKKALGNY